ncbi:hypothetical protein D3C72_1611000 [compost metagenome]
MRSLSRPLAALAACLALASCGSFKQPSSAPPPPPSTAYPAAALQLCQAPPSLRGAHVDDTASALLHMYGLYAICAGIHAELVRWAETQGRQ